MPGMVAKCKVNMRYKEKNWDANDAGQFFEQRLNWNDPIFQVAAATVNYDITTYPGGAFVFGAFARCTQNWTGGALATSTFSIGTTATPTLYMAATTVFTGAPKNIPGAAVQPPGTAVNAASPLANGTIRVQLIVTGGNANLLTAGRLDIYIWLQFFGLRLT